MILRIQIPVDVQVTVRIEVGVDHLTVVSRPEQFVALCLLLPPWLELVFLPLNFIREQFVIIRNTPLA